MCRSDKFFDLTVLRRKDKNNEKEPVHKKFRTDLGTTFLSRVRTAWFLQQVPLHCASSSIESMEIKAGGIYSCVISTAQAHNLLSNDNSSSWGTTLLSNAVNKDVAKSLVLTLLEYAGRCSGIASILK